MVAQRSKKVAKYTYAERESNPPPDIFFRLPAGIRHSSPVLYSISCIGVLGALSQVKKEHRKHAVHLATIRAQGEYEIKSYKKCV
jgi:hypothetical protein